MKDLQIQNVNSDEGINNPRGTIGTIPFHDTQGKIEVNGGGQLQYTLPIALPPGIKSVAPQINLGYASGSGNGIAGYGWNI
ncbi:SpvB/TcaC N-terminal domain-containing protein, partial [Staphylococcus caprae]